MVLTRRRVGFALLIPRYCRVWVILCCRSLARDSSKRWRWVSRLSWFMSRKIADSRSSAQAVILCVRVTFLLQLGQLNGVLYSTLWASASSTCVASTVGVCVTRGYRLLGGARLLVVVPLCLMAASGSGSQFLSLLCGNLHLSRYNAELLAECW